MHRVFGLGLSLDEQQILVSIVEVLESRLRLGEVILEVPLLFGLVV